jgi:predicted AlkP superfamily pyrophosphatase or phosphodiesterase
MRTLLTQILLSCCVLLAFAARADTNHHVILITIDGGAAFYMKDSAAPIPTLRKLAAQGVVGEGMRVSNPSITWPNHTTLVTGVHPEKHSVLFNGVLIRPGDGQSVRVEPKRTKAQLVAVPTLYDLLFAKGYRTAGVNWPSTRESGTLHDDFPDVPDTLNYTTPRLVQELFANGTLAGQSNTNFTRESGPRRDQIWTEAATHLLRTRPPNFMMFHLLITDSVQHRYGPRTLAAHAALGMADAHIRDLLDTLDETGLRARTTLFIVSDHGFETSTNFIHANVALRKAGLLTTNLVSTNPAVYATRAQIISEGGTALVYFTNPQTKAQDHARAVEVFRATEGIAEIIGPEKFAELGLPDRAKNPQMGELVLTAKPGYAFSNNSTGEEAVTTATLNSGGLGSHGYLASNPNMNALFIAVGRGIKRGTKVGLVDNRDVAPTMAHLLGQKLPGADGKVLTEILE